MKIVEREKAIKLRGKGLTYAEIGQRLGVSKGSLSLWLGNVPYVPTKETNERRRMASINTGQVLHRRKIERITQIKTEAAQEISDIGSKELKLLGIMAYWAEGSKTKDDLVKFTNTNPRFIKFVLRWLREICCVPKEKLRLHLRVHRDIDIESTEGYWSKITKIPRKQFYKTTIKTSGSNGRRFNKLSNGIVSIIVCDTKLFYKIMAWIEAVVDKAKS